MSPEVPKVSAESLKTSDLKPLEQVMITVGELGAPQPPGSVDFTIPGDDKFYTLGDKLAGTDLKISAILGKGSDDKYSRVRIEVMTESVKEPYYVEFEVGQPVFREDRMSPELFKFYGERYFVTPTLENVFSIVGIPLGEKPRTQPKEQLAVWRRKTQTCSDLLNRIFLFPDTETATMFVSSWFADGAKVILQGVPGTGKTTLIESSTQLFLCDKYRYEDAKFYYRNNFVPEKEMDPKKRGFAYYKIGDKAQKPFTVTHYLNMYRKHWARCDQCSRPATLKDVVAPTITERGMQKHWFRCENPNCPGRVMPFSRKAGEVVRGFIGQEIIPTEEKDLVGWDAVKKGFAAEEQAERFMLDYKSRSAGRPKSTCDKCAKDYEEWEVSAEDWAFLPAEHLNEKLCEPCYRDILTKAGRDVSAIKIIPVSHDYLWVEDTTTGWHVKFCSHATGYIFGLENFEPLLGIAKITPKKRPEEIFYYTEIEKEISAGKERFLMPPKARPIVKANVKFFNEFNRSKPEVQDEVLSLLEEGEVEYKGESFYSNTPFVAFFDLNPHKEQRETVLDWAFYDRLDCQLVMPSMNFGNKLEILTTRVNLRQAVFEKLMTDTCIVCGAPVLRDDEKCDECGSTEIRRGVEPIFIDELDAIRREIRDSVGVTEDALFALAIITDLYGRSYYRYTVDNPVMKLRKKEFGITTDKLVNPFIDISTVQWWSRVKKGDGKGIDVDTSGKKATEGKGRLFMMTTGGGLERPLGFRVCLSILKMAKARAWFLTMTEQIKVGDRAKDPDLSKRLPEMVKEELSDAEVRKLRMAKRKALERKKVDPATIFAEVAKIKKGRVHYRFLECPNCGEKVSTTADPEQVKGNKQYTCGKCKYPFYMVFAVSLTPEDIIAVFPYCASMRFCADYEGGFIPDEVWKRYPNVTDWLKDEVSGLWEDGDFRAMVKTAKESFDSAFATCARTDISAKKRSQEALKNLEGLIAAKAEDYPFFYQGIEYTLSACGEKGFAERWPAAPKGEQWVPSTATAVPGGPPPDEKGEFGIGRDKVTRRKQSWDIPPE
jgi:predicted RNA-binding Zn-ribbon protein involved in translation (DUF1610 family)